MDLILLAVDNDIVHFNNHEALWKKYGITPMRVSTMQDAIERIMNEEYILVGINGDNINYQPLLSIMRDITPLPIHIYTSIITYERKLEAIKLGADSYELWYQDSEKTIILCTVVLQRYMNRNSHSKRHCKCLFHNGIFLSLKYRKVFSNDIEIELTRKEFDVLYLLMSDCKRVFTYEQILRNVWGEEYIDANNSSLWNLIKRLKKKINIHSSEVPHYIKNVHDIGYVFDY